MIGIIGAMDVEVEALVGAMEKKREITVGAHRFYAGTLEGKEVVIAKCGVGKVFAAALTQAMILRFSPDLILNTGVAGTLTDRLTVGNVAIARRAVQHDMDTSAVGDPYGLVSGINRIYFDADEDAAARLAAAAKTLGLKYAVGTVASGDHFVFDPAEKKKITDYFEEAVCCEMEGGAIAHVAFLHGTPFAIVRTISDSADGSCTVDYAVFRNEAAKISSDLVRQYLKLL